MAKMKEIQNLLKRGNFKVILKEDLPQDENILPGRFVLSLKSTEDGMVKFKARYFIGGHVDNLSILWFTLLNKCNLLPYVCFSRLQQY